MKTLYFPESFPVEALKGRNMELDPIAQQCWTVGRRPDCNVQIRHELVSGKHCRIRFTPPDTAETEGSWEIADMGSTNGTYLNGKKLSPKNWEPLELQAKIFLGPGIQVIFTEEDDTLQAEQETDLLQPQTPAQTPAPKTYADVLYAIATWAVSAPTVWETIGRLFMLALVGFGAFILISQVV